MGGRNLLPLSIGAEVKNLRCAEAHGPHGLSLTGAYPPNGTARQVIRIQPLRFDLRVLRE